MQAKAANSIGFLKLELDQRLNTAQEGFAEHSPVSRDGLPFVGFPVSPQGVLIQK